MSGINLNSSVNISFADGDKFDKYLNENRAAKLPECGDLEIVTKEGGMQSGKSMAIITWTVYDENSKTHKRVQAPISLANLAMLGQACQGRMEFEASQKSNDRNSH